MTQIVGYAVLFLILIFLMNLMIALILNKFYDEEKEKELIISMTLISILEIIQIISSISNLFSKSYILFYIYLCVLLGIMLYSVIKNKLLISKYLFTYSIILLIINLWGRTIISSVANIFKLYILSISLSPLSNTSEMNLTFSMNVIIFIMGVTLLHNLIRILKIDSKKTKPKTKPKIKTVTKVKSKQKNKNKDEEIKNMASSKSKSKSK